MMPTTAEKRHKAGRHQYWNESYYFNFISDKGRWGGAMRLGFSPNQKLKDGFIIFYFPDGRSGFIRCSETLPDDEELSVGAFELNCIEPFQRWAINYRGPIYYFDDSADAGIFLKTMLVDLPRREVDLSLEFDCFHQPFDFHKSTKLHLLSLPQLFKKLKPSYFSAHISTLMLKLKMLPAMGGAHHYEQAGHVSGAVVIDGEKHLFEGTGQRDHSWGVRDMRVINRWQWFSCQFGDELAFNATRVELLGFQVVGGHAYYKGQCHALKDWKFTGEMDESGKWARRFEIKLILENGEILQVKGNAKESFPVPLTTKGLTAVVNETLADFQWNQEHSVGIAEFMGQEYP